MKWKVNDTSRTTVDLSFVFLGYLIILAYFYPVATLLPNIIQIPVFVLWLFSIRRKNRLWGNILKISMINIIIFIVSFIRCIAAEHLNLNYFSTMQVVIQRYNFLIFPVLFVYINSLDRYHKKKIYQLAFFCIFITLLFSLYYVFFVDPQAIRNTQRDFLWGVGDFTLMYAIAILSGPLLFLIIEKVKKKEKILYLLIFYLTILLTILLCNLVTSVVIAVVSTFVMYCVSKKRKVLLVILFPIAFVFLILRKVFAKLLYMVAEKGVFYWSTSNKLIAIANIINGVGNSSNTDTFAKRIVLAAQSVGSFKEYPLFGIDWKYHVSGKIGCHMQWADDLGRYGIVGNLLLIPNYFFIARYTIKSSRVGMARNSIITCWIVFVILGFLNPNLSTAILMLMFVVIPTFDSAIEVKDEKDTGR